MPPVAKQQQHECRKAGRQHRRNSIFGLKGVDEMLSRLPGDTEERKHERPRPDEGQPAALIPTPRQDEQTDTCRNEDDSDRHFDQTLVPACNTRAVAHQKEAATHCGDDAQDKLENAHHTQTVIGKNDPVIE